MFPSMNGRGFRVGGFFEPSLLDGDDADEEALFGPLDARGLSAAHRAALANDEGLAAVGDVELADAANSVMAHPPIWTPAKFIETTAIRFKMRSEDTVKVDRAYAAFYARVASRPCEDCGGAGSVKVPRRSSSRSPSRSEPSRAPAMMDLTCASCSGTGQHASISPASAGAKPAAAALLGALRELKAAKGGDWSKVTRNVSSGGLLLRWCQYLEFVWGPILEADANAARQATMAATGRAVASGGLNAATQRLHTRYGVIWLLGNIAIDLDWKVELLQGAVALGSAGAFAGVNGASGSVSAMTDTLVLGTKAGSVVKGVGAVGGIVSGPMRTKVGERGEGTTRLGREGALTERNRDMIGREKQWFRAPELFPVTREIFSEVVKNVNGVEDIPGMLVGGSLAMGAAVVTDVVKETIHTIGQPIYTAVIAFLETCQKMWFDGEAVGTATVLIKAIAGWVVGVVCKEALPFVGGALNLGKGLAGFVNAASERHTLWAEKRKFKLAAGHFSMIGASIESQVSMGMFYGFTTMLKGAADITANVFLPGAGALASVMMSALEWAGKALYRQIEHASIEQFLKLAERQFGYENTWYGKTTRPHTNSILPDDDAFQAFFKKGCKSSVVIPMLTLNSGMCGSIWEQIETVMNGEVISQASFDAGVKYFGLMKRFSGTYLRSAGFTFKGRVKGSQADVTIRHALLDHRQAQSIGAMVLGGLAK